MRISNLLLFSILLICSCGGVIGYINMDSFNCSESKLNECIKELYLQNILIKPDKNSTYTGNDMDTIALVKFKSDTFAFGYLLQATVSAKPKPFLTILHFGKNGELLVLDHNLSFRNRWKFKEIYNKIILPELKKCGCEPD